jgi:lysophospholipase L1-like esterase
LRRWHVVILALLGASALACDGAGSADPGPTSGEKPRSGYPSSMVALGDSLTAAYGSCPVYVACSRNSWATGKESSVDSHATRIAAKNPAMKGHARNLAVPGADSGDLTMQAAAAADAEPDYVTLLIGANDACADTVDEMTPAATFRDRVDKALATVKKGAPKARVLVVSIPDLYRLWELGHTHPEAVRAWDRGICPSLLADPADTGSGAKARRLRVADRVDDYNTALRKACRSYGKRCRWDGGEAHGVRFSFDLVNTYDYFHPNVKGQARIADVTYPGRFTW